MLESLPLTRALLVDASMSTSLARFRKGNPVAPVSTVSLAESPVCSAVSGDNGRVESRFCSEVVVAPLVECVDSSTDDGGGVLPY